MAECKHEMKHARLFSGLLKHALRPGAKEDNTLSGILASLMLLLPATICVGQPITQTVLLSPDDQVNLERYRVLINENPYEESGDRFRQTSRRWLEDSRHGKAESHCHYLRELLPVLTADGYQARYRNMYEYRCRRFPGQARKALRRLGYAEGE